MAYAAKLGINTSRKNRKGLDQELGSPWFYRPVKSASPEQFLEDEIYFLRRRMEQMFNQEQSLTSESVIEVSSLLDRKINEYMNKVSQSR
jgi:hypothetical protein